MNEKEKKSIIKELDSLIDEIAASDENPNQETLDIIDEILLKISNDKKKKQDDKEEASSQRLVDKLQDLIEATNANKAISSGIATPIIEAIEKIKLDIPYPNVQVEPPKVIVTVPEIKIPQIIIPEIKVPDVVMPKEIEIKKPFWLKIEPLKPIIDSITEIKNAIINFKLPTSAKDAIAVRLSDGDKFYRALGGLVSSIGSNFPFKLSTGATEAALVDTDGHVQNDVLSSALPEGASTSDNQGKFRNVVDGLLYGYKTVDGKPRISSMPYLYDIAEGNVTAHTPFTKLGYNGDVGATEEDIITQGGVYPWFPAGGVALEVVSSDANDTLAGTGVQKVKITYLDTTYAQQTQTLNMNGVTPVPLTDTHILRVNSIRATQVGTNNMSVGQIDCRLVGGAATIYRSIVAGYTRGRGITFTVPLGKTLYITSIAVSSGYTTAGKVVRWIARAQVDDTDPTTKINFFQPFFEIITQDASFHRDFEMPIKIPATADVKVSAVSNGAGSFCNCALRGWLE